MINIDETYDIPADIHDRYPQAFLLKVVGDSMNRVLPNGCYALINPCQEASKPMKAYAVCVNGFDATIKRVKPLSNGYELIPDSIDPTCIDLDRSAVTHIYVDGIENTKGNYGDSQNAISLTGDALKAGDHTVEVVQFKGDDVSGEVVFYRKLSYQIAN